MSKQKSKRVATGKGKSGCASVNGYAALAERAYVHGRRAAIKAHGSGYNRSWLETPEPTRKGFVAMVKFIAKELKRPNVRTDAQRKEP